MRGTLWFGALVAGVGIVSSSAAYAGWDATRGDARRTGFSSASGAIDAPGIRWRLYLGGAADRRSFQAVAGTYSPGSSDLVYLTASGRVEARRPDDILVWRSAIVSADHVLGVSDLDGDGRAELVAVSRGSGRAFVFDAADGDLVWSAPVGRYGQIGVAALRDIDGDGLDDLYLSAWGSFNLRGPQWADAWTFSGPLAAPLWSIDITTRDYDRAENDAWADVDGDGRAELVAFGREVVYVYSSLDGSLVASGNIGSIPFAQAQTIVANVDPTGDPGEEVVIFTNTAYGATLSTRHVMVLDVAGGVVSVRWRRGVGDVLADLHSYVGESVADVDGDGALDVISSFSAGAIGPWTTYVYRGATGELVASMPGEVVGVTDVDGDAGAEVLTRPGPDQLGVSAWDVTGTTATLRWTRDSAQWLVEDDPATANRQSLTQRTIRFDVDGDGQRELIVADKAPGQWRLQAFDLSASNPTPKQTYPLTNDAKVLAVQRQTLRDGERLLAARSDGFLAVLDHGLHPLNEWHYQGGVIPGMKIGGYYPGWRGIWAAASLSGDLFGDDADDLVARDSRGAVVALDASGATMSRPPSTEWSVLSQGWMPSLADVDGDGEVDVVTGGDGVVSLRDARTGNIRWASAVGGEVSGHLTAVDTDGDGAAEVGYMNYDPPTGDQVIGLLRSNGVPAWPAEIRKRSSGRGSYSISDLNGDGVADTAVQLGYYLLTIDGATGSVLSDQYTGVLSMAPLVADVDGNDDPEIVTSGFIDAYQTYDVAASGVPTIRGQVQNAPATEVSAYHYGALVPCASGPRYVFAAQNSNHVRVIDPSGLTVALDAYLGGGQVYASAGQVPATTGAAYLGNVNAMASLGDGTPRALVGSTDGYLYVLRPCTTQVAGLLDWSRGFEAPVGEPIPSDVDGDGAAEIIVATQAGYLYAIDQAAMNAPALVGEVASAGTLVGGELDELTTDEPLRVEWQVVPGAVSYEVAVFDGVGAAMTSPAFLPAGSGTSFVIDGLALQPGLPYFTVVRAVAPSGERSFEQVSDGFRRLARPAEPPDPADPDEPSTDGGCRTSNDGSAFALFLAALALVSLRARRNRA